MKTVQRAIPIEELFNNISNSKNIALYNFTKKIVELLASYIFTNTFVVIS